MGAKSLLLVGGVAIATLLYLVYLAATFEAPEGTTTIVIPPPTLQPLEPEIRQPAPVRPAPSSVDTPAPEPLEEIAAGEPEATPEPAEDVQEVIEEEPEAEVVQLPNLNNSDDFIKARLRQISNGAALLNLLTDEQLVRRFVVLVDNVSRGNLPQNNQAYRTLPGDLPVRSVDDNLFEMTEAGYRRFDSVVNTLDSIDAEQAAALYRLALPLFQQAYAEIGYRDVNFDDTLQRALRTVLQTNEIEGPFQLVKPSVMYLYADSEIEALSDIQKQMIRIGPANSQKFKTKLRAIMQAL